MPEDIDNNAENDFPEASDNASFGEASPSNENDEVFNQSDNSNHTNTHSYTYHINNYTSEGTSNSDLSEAKKANNLTRWGLFVNTGLLIATLLALVITWRSIDLTNQSVLISKEALVSSQKTDSINRIRDKEQDSISRVERENTYLKDSINLGLARESSNLATESFNEIKKSNEFSRGSVMKELRAYISISRFTLENFEIDSIFHVTAPCINVGKTPAYNCRLNLKYGFGHSITDVNIDSLLNSQKPPNPLTITVGQEIISYTASTFPMQKNDFITFSSGRLKIFAVFFIDYEDIFGERHYSRLVAEYKPKDRVFNIFSEFTLSD